MIFKEISLNNFRQFRGECTFTFPYSDNNTITLIIAPNGVGKTTFSQAVRFFFYGESPNVLKLPKPEDNLNYSLIEDLRGGEEAELSVRVKFSHNNRNYIASRNVVFQKELNQKNKLKKIKSNFELWEDTIYRGNVKVENGDKRIREMMPIGLTHVYMFDGERVEKSISSLDFKRGLKESIVGILGLNKLEQAKVFLGNEGKKNSIIGKLSSQIKPLDSTEQQVLDTKEHALENIEKSKKERANIEQSIDTLTYEIEKAKKAQKSVDVLNGVIKDYEIAKRNVSLEEQKFKELVKQGNDLAGLLTFKLEIAKTYSKYQKFIKSEGEQPEIFENLYESVIQDIFKRKVCICGRAVHEDSQEAKILRSLSALPHDNAHYLNSLKSLYSSLDDIPLLLEKLESYNSLITQTQINLEALRTDEDQANELVQRKEAEIGEKNQTNIDKLMGHRAAFKNKGIRLDEEIKKNEKIIKNISKEINIINYNTAYNTKINTALKMLATLRQEIDNELEAKKTIAKSSIQNNMNAVLSQVMTQRYIVELDDDYKITVWKIDGNSNRRQEETEVLSTGQNVVIYLSFLRALLMTVEEHSEFSDVQSSGVIMDAALSNVDEAHINQISHKILNSFDQLIFLSYKAQLRRELISGIKNNIEKVYELSKDSKGNIICKTLPVENIEEYVNEGEIYE